MPRILAAVVVLVAAASLSSCGEDEDQGDCVNLCQDAQALGCTAITGDCGEFCQALFNVENPSGCADERRIHQDCLAGEDVCGGACSGAETDLTGCVGGYCAGHLGDADCQVLLTSF